MKLKDDDSFQILGRLGERITVEISAIGSEQAVTYSLNEIHPDTVLKPGETIQFALDKTRARLDLVFNVSPHARIYRVLVSGDASNEVSEHTLIQPADTESHLVYTFSVDRGDSGTVEGVQVKGGRGSITVNQDIHIDGDEAEIIGIRIRSIGGDESKGDYE